MKILSNFDSGNIIIEKMDELKDIVDTTIDIDKIKGYASVKQ